MRLTDADVVLADIDALKSSPWFKAEYISDERRLGIKEALDMMSSIIRHSPTIDAEPIRRGSWIFIRDEGGGNSLYSCSECGQGDIQSPEVVVPYCWHCGAKMDAERKEE